MNPVKIRYRFRAVASTVGLFCCSLVSDPRAADITVLGAEPWDQVTLSQQRGDFDGDGSFDWLVVASGASPLGRTNAGQVCVFWASEDLDSIVDLAITTAPKSVILPRNGDYGIYARVCVGDFNDDERDDIALGVPCLYPSLSCEGKTYVVWGTDAFPAVVDLEAPSIAVSTIAGSWWDDGWLGRSLTTADFNGDGIDDLVLAAPFFDDTGEVYVVYGSAGFPAFIDLTTATSGITRIVDPSFGVGSGYALAAADADEDGAWDILIGAFGNVPGTFDGKATLLFGLSTPPDTMVLGAPTVRQAVLRTDSGVQGNLGIAVALGDCDGDGNLDAVVSAPNAFATGCSFGNCGVVYVVSHAANLPTITNLDAPSPFITRYSGGTKRRLGGSIAVGDLDSDGRDDIAMSAQPASVTTDPKMVIVAYGPPPQGQLVPISDFAGTLTLFGKAPGDNFGDVVVALDVNSDGAFDLLTGAHYSDPMGRTNAGEAYLYFGTAPVTTVQPTSVAPLGARLVPNPFGDSATLQFQLAAPSEVTLRVYDVRGRLVDAQYYGTLGAGDQELRWPAASGASFLASGIYFARLQVGNRIQTVRMHRIR